MNKLIRMLRLLLVVEWRFLSFRPLGPELQEQPRRVLAFGLVLTVLAGVGRHWDNSHAAFWQLLGLGSIAYVLFVALLLWLLLMPLKPKGWDYDNVLLFLSLTSAPALVYAIPVERFLSAEMAANVNTGFVVLVVSWRTLLLAFFLRRVADLSPLATTVGTLLPLSLVITALGLLSLEPQVFGMMSGNRELELDDFTYTVLLAFSNLASFLLLFLLVAYGMLAYRAAKGPEVN